jgi:hypothetical protein
MIGIALVLTHGTFCDGGDHGFNLLRAAIWLQSASLALHWGTCVATEL